MIEIKGRGNKAVFVDRHIDYPIAGWRASQSNFILVVAHVMAQISHECGAGHDVVENLNYTAGRTE